MTDKEIIIDGVDVSECDFLWKEKLPKKVCNNGNLDCNCNSNPNCYFKQLKRKEQELQAQRDFTTQEQHKIYCVAYDKTCETGNDCKQKNCVFKDRLKYKQALDEIEKIANKQRKFDLTGKTPLIPVINEVGGDFIDILDIVKRVKED